MKNRLLMALMLSIPTVYASTASADYSFEVVSPPGALLTQTFGINNAGKVTGNADDGVTFFSFEYDMKTGEYTTISEVFGVLDISNSGVMVGSVDGACAIRDKDGSISIFTPPSFGPNSVCTARGVNSNGKVAGFVIDDGGVWRGFVHDPNKDSFEEFLPSGQTIAHAINAKGQNVGSVRLDADVAYPGSPEGRYGYLRDKDGAEKFFEIGQSVPGFTRARGISESELVAGFYADADTFESKSYVTTLGKGTEFETVVLTDDEVVYQKPCDSNLPPPPGPDYELFTEVFASQVRNDGVVVGSCSDIYVDPITGEAVFYNNGFIATPVK